MTVGFQSLGLGVVRRLLSAFETVMEPWTISQMYWKHVLKQLSYRPTKIAMEIHGFP